MLRLGIVSPVTAQQMQHESVALARSSSKMAHPLESAQPFPRINFLLILSPEMQCI